jgi:hypothetical protein
MKHISYHSALKKQAMQLSFPLFGREVDITVFYCFTNKKGAPEKKDLAVNKFVFNNKQDFTIEDFQHASFINRITFAKLKEEIWKELENN